MITGKTLIDWGYPQCYKFGEMLKLARELKSEGVDIDTIRSEVMNNLPEPKLEMNVDSPAIYTEAIRVQTEEEENNLKDVRVQMDELMQCPVVLRGSVMPDTCVAGTQKAMIPVGGAIEVDNAIIPAAHSADICCSMFATIFRSSVPDKQILDTILRTTHFGFGGRDVPFMSSPPELPNNPFLNGLENYAQYHMGTQGDGNHFAYLGELVVDDLLIEGLKSAGSNTGNLVKGRSYKVLVTHHGSRGLGAKVYKRGSKVAETLTNKVAANIPKACHWIPFDTKEGRDYWDALQYIRNWTRQNHDEIHRRVVSRLGVEELVFWNEHNFVWKRGNSFYHGKGATPSWSMGNYQSLGLIPLNMTEPILITTSTNNDKYLSFAPHGAGRNRSRTATLAPFKNDDGSFDEGALAAAIEADTESIDVRWYSGKPDLSECPRGYKNASEVIKQIEEFNLAKIVGRIYPIGCVMAGEQPPQPWQITKS